MSNTDSLRRITRSKKAAINRNDPERFKPPGLDFKGKLIGVEDVPEARGDKMCQVAMAKLKAAVRTIGDHKQRIVINVSLDGIKILDEKSEELLHRHIVQRISFIARDVSDTRAFGYVYGCPDGRHQFYGIKTEKVAEGIVLSLRDLFQVVFDLKKREVEEARRQQLDSLSSGTSSLSGGSSLLATNNRLNSANMSDNSSSARGSLQSDDVAHLENELDHIEQGLDHINAYTLPPTSPGGNSWPLSSMWDSSTTPPALQDKYNTLPTGSAALYRSLFATSSMTGVTTGSRSPLAVRASSLRLQSQQPAADEEMDSMSGLTYQPSQFTGSGTMPRTTARLRNKSTSSLQRPTAGGSQLPPVLPPPTSVPSTRRSTSSLSSLPQTPSAVDVQSTGWAKFDLSPLAESVTAASGTSAAVEESSTDDVFRPRANTTSALDSSTAERYSPPSVSGFADFPSPESQKTDRPSSVRGPESTSDATMGQHVFADSFVAASFDDLGKTVATDSANTTAVFDLMSPSSDRDSLSLPSPDAPPPPLPTGGVASDLPIEPPVPPPRPRARANSRVGRNLEQGFSAIEFSAPPSNHSTPSHHAGSRPGSVAADQNAFEDGTSSNGVTCMSDHSHHSKHSHHQNIAPANADQPKITGSPRHVGFWEAFKVAAGLESAKPAAANSGASVAGHFGPISGPTPVAPFPFHFPPDDRAPPPPPRPASSSVCSGPVRASYRPVLVRGASVPCAPLSNGSPRIFSGGAGRGAGSPPPPPPPRRSVKNATTSLNACDPFSPIVYDTLPQQSSVSAKLESLQSLQQSTASPLFSDGGIVETTINPLPRPRPHVRSITQTSTANSSPWQQMETTGAVPEAASLSTLDPFVKVDPFATDGVTPDDPFAEPSSILDGFLADDFDAVASLQSTSFCTRAVTIDSVSSDIFDMEGLSVVPRVGGNVSSASSGSRDMRPAVENCETSVDWLVDLGGTNANTQPAGAAPPTGTVPPVTTSGPPATSITHQPSFDKILNEFDERFPAFDEMDDSLPAMSTDGNDAAAAAAAAAVSVTAGGSSQPSLGDAEVSKLPTSDQQTLQMSNLFPVDSSFA